MLLRFAAAHAVELGVSGIGEVGIFAGLFIEEPVVFGKMVGNAELHAPGGDRLFQRAEVIHPRAVHGIIGLLDIGGVQRVGIVVDAHRHHVFRPRGLEKLRPLLRAAALFPVRDALLKFGDKIFVTHGFRAAVGFEVVGIDIAVAVACTVGDIHPVPVPFVAEGGHGIHAVMDENTELCVAVPFGYFVIDLRVSGQHGRLLFRTAGKAAQNAYAA